MRRFRKTTLALLVALAVPLAGLAQPTPPANEVNNNPFGALATNVKERVLQMSEFLDTVLPGTLGARNVTLHFTPKFTDLRSREFVRFPVEVRYGATNQLELIAGLSPFTPNPINSGKDHRWGPGEAKLGARYDLGIPLFFYDKATVGIETRVPLGRPPVELNEGFTHIRPFLSTSRILRSVPWTTFYTNFSYDRTVKLVPRDPPERDVVRRHVGEISPGLLYKPGEFGYFGEYHFQHIQEPDNSHLAHEVQIGPIWDVPLWRSARWHLPGKWQAELGLKYRTEEGHGSSQGVSLRVNWKTTLREVLTHVTSSGNGQK
jgi:hypothetical protein